MKDKDVLRVNEIFRSIQGESLSQGFPCVFVRLYGCNLNCSYCDTKQGEDDFTLMTSKEVYNKVKELNVSEDNTNLVCITGGEPLLQAKALHYLLRALVNTGDPYFSVVIESNGATLVPTNWEDKLVDEINFVFDVKTPSSGIKVDWDIIRKNMWAVSMDTEFKFVVSNLDDMDFAVDAIDKIKNFYMEYQKSKGWEFDDIYFFPQFSFSPVYQGDDRYFAFANWIANFLIHNNINARLQLQLHKLIGVK